MTDDPVGDPAELSAADAAAAIRAGRLTATALTEACLERIAARDPAIQAWTHLDPDHALDQARQADARRVAGDTLGPLHGVPVAVKDIFETADMPTGFGSSLHAGWRSGRDATAVALLRQAGAVILGKTVTTEFALFSPGKTRNPAALDRSPSHTPGGSSSGSAAAVASGMAPFALGSQTAGSIIRPASYCGVVGYKPTHGLISRTHVLGLSRPLDTIGTLARSVRDAALLAETMMTVDPSDPDMRPTTPPALTDSLAEPLSAPPRFAFARTGLWEQVDADCQAAFEAFAADLGAQCEAIDLPEPVDRGPELQRAVMLPDVARALGDTYDGRPDGVSEALAGLIAEGRRMPAVASLEARDAVPALNAALAPVFRRFDAILTPSAAGAAPSGLDFTGSPQFCVTWTLCGTPAVTLPLLRSEKGLPVGVQLVGRRGDDARLLRVAEWLMQRS